MLAVASDGKTGKRDGNDDPEILLGLLSAIEQDSRVTQRSLSKELGIALGLANAYLKRCATKGLIKVSQVPLNRYAYYLTPKGFSEKSRLTAEYLAISFNFFRDARGECSAIFLQASRRGWQRMILVGAGDLAEIATLSASDSGIEICGVVDEVSTEGRCAGLPIVADISAAEALAGPKGGIDGFLITDTRSPQEAFDRVRSHVVKAGIDATIVVAPPMLRVSANEAEEAPEGVA